jgi:hypothetical protein
MKAALARRLDQLDRGAGEAPMIYVVYVPAEIEDTAAAVSTALLEAGVTDAPRSVSAIITTVPRAGDPARPVVVNSFRTAA